MKKYKYDWGRVPVAEKDAYLDRIRTSVPQSWYGVDYEELVQKARVALRTKAEVNADKVKLVDAYYAKVSTTRLPSFSVNWNALGVMQSDDGITYAEALNALYEEETSD